MRVGFLGYGQLGRMMAMSIAPWSLGARFYDKDTERVYGSVVPSDPYMVEGPDALMHFLKMVDYVTYETENTPVELVEHIAQNVQVYPTIDALRITQNRLYEKTLCQSLGIGVAPFCAVDSWATCEKAAEQLGYPLILKTVTMGYDGKGQRIVREVSELQSAWEALSKQPLIAEAWVKFSAECSLIGVQNRAGEQRFYPLVENTHRAGILRYSLIQAEKSVYQTQAESIAKQLWSALPGYVGVLTIEFFVTEQGLYVNELAPRVHNSGHWTIEGAQTSQFQNHMRAILDKPLGSTALQAPSVGMINIIGDVRDTTRILCVPGAFLHLYGKSPRFERKLGHITLMASNAQDREEQLHALREYWAS